jgi:hypothetical protein
MTAATVACPYCNAYVTLPEPVPPGRRVTCALCGEAFAYRPLVAGLVAAPPPGTDGPPHARDFPGGEPLRRWNRRTAALILGIMGIMAVLALAVSLRTVDRRRALDQEPLGYLPPDTNVMAGLHVAKLLKDPAGREFASQSHLGPADVGVVNLEQWTGLPLEALADVVLGLKVSDQLIPRLTLVVQTLKPYDEAKVRAALKDSQQIERHQKKLYRFRLDRPPVTATLWCAGQSTLVYGLSPEDLDAVPLTPHPGIDHLPAPLQGYLTNPSNRQAQAWTFATNEHWDRTVVWPVLSLQLGKDLGALKGVQTVGVWFRFDREVVVNALAQCTDPAAAQALEQLLRRSAIGKEATLQIELDNRVTGQAQFSPEAFRRLVGEE